MARQRTVAGHLPKGACPELQINVAQPLAAGLRKTGERSKNAERFS